MPSIPPYYTDQFDNSNPARGDLSESIGRSGILAGILTAGTVNAGDRVKLDSAITAPGFIGFVAADDDEEAFGVVKRTPKQTVFVAGNEDTNKLEVVFSGSQCVYQVGNTTLTPGTKVGLEAGFLVAADGTHSQMGLLIDYVVASSIGRVIMGWVPC